MSPRTGSRRRRVRPVLVVESDLPRLSGVLSWERELLVPIVEQFVEEVLAEDVPADQTPESEPHAEKQDQEP